jgi:carbon storage regulator
MLYLTRRPGEAVIINNAIEVRVVELKGKSVKLGFTFPSDATVLREEVFLQIKAENEAAVAASAEVLRGRTQRPTTAPAVGSEVGTDRPAVPLAEPEIEADDSAGVRPHSGLGGGPGASDRVTVPAGGGPARRPDDI